jgi:hypothetical protein
MEQLKLKRPAFVNGKNIRITAEKNQLTWGMKLM